jgi:hypothetical protein
MRRGQLLGSMSLPRTCKKIREGELLMVERH